MTYAQIIIKNMQEQPDRKWFTYELQKVSTPHGWLGSSTDRTLRLMAEKGILYKEREGKYERFWLQTSNLPLVKTPQKKVIGFKEINGQPTAIYA